MSSDSAKPTPLTNEVVQQLYDQYSDTLTNFLLGILRDHASASDAVQATFTKLLEKGHLVENQNSMKSWLYRVAFNEALLIKRKAKVKQRHAEPLAWKINQSAGADKGNDKRLSQSVQHAVRRELVQQVREALQQLPETHQAVVRMRIFDGLKFREIAEQLDTPLGTVLARMQSALKKLEPLLREADDEQ